MTKFKLLSAALIAAAMLAPPAMARTSQVHSRYLERDTGSSTFPNASFIDGHVAFPAPSVGAFLPTPPDGEDCDVGDNARVC
jgi:prepilin-type processing-associated H-X9-DG protein